MNPYQRYPNGKTPTDESTLMEADETQRSSRAPIVGSLLFSVMLLASLWLFLERPNHRIGGVAWNALFQIFGPFGALFVATVVAAKALSRKTHRAFGLLASAALLTAAGVCVAFVFPRIMSI